MEAGQTARSNRAHVALEFLRLERIAHVSIVAILSAECVLPEHDAVRRQLLGKAVGFTPTMAATACADEICKDFGLVASVEVHQPTGRENAAIHLSKHPILVKVQGRLLSLLDEGALRA